jgi:hypothetical protein
MQLQSKRLTARKWYTSYIQQKINILKIQKMFTWSYIYIYSRDPNLRSSQRFIHEILTQLKLIKHECFRRVHILVWPRRTSRPNNLVSNSFWEIFPKPSEGMTFSEFHFRFVFRIILPKSQDGGGVRKIRSSSFREFFFRNPRTRVKSEEFVSRILLPKSQDAGEVRRIRFENSPSEIPGRGWIHKNSVQFVPRILLPKSQDWGEVGRIRFENSPSEIPGRGWSQKTSVQFVSRICLRVRWGVEFQGVGEKFSSSRESCQEVEKGKNSADFVVIYIYKFVWLSMVLSMYL